MGLKIVKIEERILHLRSEIEELRIIAEQSGIKHQTGLRYAEILAGLDLTKKDNLKIFYKITKENYSYFVEYLRDKIAVIMKASPKNAETLTRALKMYEEKARELLKEYENAKTFLQLDKKTRRQEFQYESVELLILAIGLKNAVEYSFECIIDIIFFDD